METGTQDARKGHNGSYGVISMSHEPCQLSGRPVLWTLEEAVRICSRSTAAALGEHWGRIGETGVNEWNTQPRNMACHNHLRQNTMPSGVNSLLRLGLNYCIKSKSTNETTNNTFEISDKSTLCKMWRMMTATTFLPSTFTHMMSLIQHLQQLRKLCILSSKQLGPNKNNYNIVAIRNQAKIFLMGVGN